MAQTIRERMPSLLDTHRIQAGCKRADGRQAKELVPGEEKGLGHSCPGLGEGSPASRVTLGASLQGMRALARREPLLPHALKLGQRLRLAREKRLIFSSCTTH